MYTTILVEHLAGTCQSSKNTTPYLTHEIAIVNSKWNEKVHPCLILCNTETNLQTAYLFSTSEHPLDIENVSDWHYNRHHQKMTSSAESYHIQ